MSITMEASRSVALVGTSNKLIDFIYVLTRGSSAQNDPCSRLSSITVPYTEISYGVQSAKKQTKAALVERGRP